MASSRGRQSIFRLPISPSAPIYHLTPDPLFPNPASLLALSAYKPPDELSSGQGVVKMVEGDPVPPSMLRRSRMVRGGGAFSYTSPLPLEFPYDIQEKGEQVEKEVGKEVLAKPVTIETKLAEFEPCLDMPVVVEPESQADSSLEPTAFTSKARLHTKIFPVPELLSLSHNCLKTWLPNMDVGEIGSDTRKNLVDVLAGKSVLARTPNEGAQDSTERLGFAPWSLCYGGHQFGSWAGQLGDGRAISILSTPVSDEVRQRTGASSVELQLKGAGRTPYSRFADGLAVLRSSIREYVGAEAMAALNLPTSRGLALVGIPGVKVRRERLETAAIVTRLARSWIRIGNFEIQAVRQEWDSLRQLSSHVGKDVFKLLAGSASLKDNLSQGKKSMALEVLKEVARRNAIMIAGWQAYGFMHGVMNTDNIAVTGECIDYGPYAFMDIFDENHICNHSDDAGRYRYNNQPAMGIFAIEKLGQALCELIGCELEKIEKESKTLSADTIYVEAESGWGNKGEADERMATWKTRGEEEVAKVVKDFNGVFNAEYQKLMSKRLGLLDSPSTVTAKLVEDFLVLLQRHGLDFNSTFRALSQFDGTTKSTHFDSFLTKFVQSKDGAAPEDWKKWFESYSQILLDSAETDVSNRRIRMNQVNPRFTIRQWVLEQLIAEFNDQKSNEPGIAFLDRVLRMASNPFEPYGEDELVIESADGGSQNATCKLESEEELEQRRLCGVGEEQMLGFQCSCSS